MNMIAMLLTNDVAISPVTNSNAPVMIKQRQLNLSERRPTNGAANSASDKQREPTQAVRNNE